MAKRNTRRSRGQSFVHFIRKHLLVILMMTSMLFGIGLGCLLRLSWSHFEKRKIFYLKFPGDIMLNTLQMLSVPLVVSSIISSLASLSMRTSGSIGLKALVYYLLTTVCAVITGTVGITIVSSGTEATSEARELSKGISQLDSLLDMMRNAFPANLVGATISKQQSMLVTHSVEIVDDTRSNHSNVTGGNMSRNFTIDVPTVTTVAGTNMLGLIVVSICVGCVLSKMEDKAKPLVDFFQCLYQVMIRLIMIFIWFTPVGLMFLVATAVVQIERPMAVLKELSIFIPAVIICLLLHGFVTIPTAYFLMVRKNPYTFINNMSKALVTAFGSSSSAAALPFTMDCLINKNRVNSRVVNFIAPIGATINMDGTALYIPMLIIFISNRLGLVLDPARYVVIGMSAIGMSVGAAAIPAAGFMFMTVAALAVGLPIEQVLLTAPVDWIFERFRTMVNVLGDSFGAGIVDHLSSSVQSPDCVEMTHSASNSQEEDEKDNLV
ncbi:excitatory amino acid transporter 1-like [Ylistrum balloti]|uniref:excitatory amino acid transporter 1-like n=1 Tax=Ylistrum balloti TaxID=509963 RepID=UPI002905B96E|nr:excitatory amino acid transporter 1-like [Ylistrum balloti]